MITKYNEKEYEIIYDKSSGCYKTPFHNDLFMMKIMLNCLEKAEYFVETGLFLGYTSYFVAKNFTNINCYSCEINSDFFKLAELNIGIIDNLKIELNKSPDALYNLKNIYNNDIFNKYCIFWIDAHWNTDPLNDEINYITSNFKKFTIFIDDFVIPYDNRFTNDGLTIEKITQNINNKGNIKIFMPYYDSNHPDCNNINNNGSQPVGYCILTTENIETFEYLKEIKLS